MRTVVYCNLSVLLAERHLKISKVSADTGISRTTLTVLAFNRWQGIRSDTIDTLCEYLDISVGDLLVYLPVNIALAGCRYDIGNGTADLAFDCNDSDFSGTIHCGATVELDGYPFSGDAATVRTTIAEYPAHGDKQKRENKILETIFRQLPPTVISLLKFLIEDWITLEISRAIRSSEECAAKYGYPSERRLWKCEIVFPPNWKRDKSHGNS